jgi:ElaB/YqjD/DUF883 family membrane-anchored ribosome-binding protein
MVDRVDKTTRQAGDIKSTAADVGGSNAAPQSTMGSTDRPTGRSSGGTKGDRPMQTHLAQDIRATSPQIMDEVREAAQQMLDEQKTRAAEAVHGVAEALRQTAGQLQQREAGLTARYAGRAADQVDRLSDMVRDQSLASLLQDTETFARRQPEWFLAGSVAAGFLLGRFLKASGERSFGSRPSQTRGPQPSEGRAAWSGGASVSEMD